MREFEERFHFPLPPNPSNLQFHQLYFNQFIHSKRYSNRPIQSIPHLDKQNSKKRFKLRDEDWLFFGLRVVAIFAIFATYLMLSSLYIGGGVAAPYISEDAPDSSFFTGAEIRFDDPAGISSAKIWMAPDSSSFTGEEIRSPSDAVDLYAIFSQTTDNSLDSKTISTIAENHFDYSSEIGSGSVQVHRGMITNVTWIGTLNSQVEIDANTLAEAYSFAVTSAVGFVAGLVGIELDTSAISSSDLLDQFGTWTLYVEAADSNANVGIGSVEFDSLIKIVLDNIEAAWQSLTQLFNKFREWTADVLEQIKDVVTSTLNFLIENILMPYLRMYLSLATTLLPYIEYFVVILESIAYVDPLSFWNHQFTQQAFSSVFDLISSYNGNSFSINERLIEHVNRFFESLDSTNILPRISSINDIFIYAASFVQFDFTSENEGISFEKMFSPKILAFMSLVLIIIRVSMAGPIVIPTPATLLMASLMTVVSIMLSRMMQSANDIEDLILMKPNLDDTPTNIESPPPNSTYGQLTNILFGVNLVISIFSVMILVFFQYWSIDNEDFEELLFSSDIHSIILLILVSVTEFASIFHTILGEPLDFLISPFGIMGCTVGFCLLLDEFFVIFDYILMILIVITKLAEFSETRNSIYGLLIRSIMLFLGSIILSSLFPFLSYIFSIIGLSAILAQFLYMIKHIPAKNTPIWYASVSVLNIIAQPTWLIYLLMVFSRS